MAKNRLPIESLQQPPLPEPQPLSAAMIDPGAGAFTYRPGGGPVGDNRIFVDFPDRTNDANQISAPDRTNDSAMVADFGGYSPRTQQVQDLFRGVRQQGMESADIEATQKRAALENWLQRGGQSPSGQVYRSPTGTEPVPSERGFAPPRPMGPSPVAAATSSYVPGGIQGAPATRTGEASAIQTGDPFFDVNTDFDRLAKEKLIRDNNDAAFSQGNDARLNDIAGDRQRAEAKRAAGLAAQGLDEKTIEQRMFPQRFAQPVDPGIAQAKQVDAAERQGRSNLHAIAQKFMRNGLSPAAAYSAAMNVTPTTNPGNMGAVPSLPGLDPMRVIQTSSPGTGMAAAQQSVGTTRADNEMSMGNQRNETERYGIDSRERVGMANAANGGVMGMMELFLKMQQQQQNQGIVSGEMNQQVRDAALQFIQDPANAPLEYGTPDQQAIWRQQMDAAVGRKPQQGPQPAPAAAPQAPPIQPGALSGAMAPPQQQPAPQSREAMLASNPAAMAQHMANIPPERQAYERARIMAAVGNFNDPYVDTYAQGQFANAPNLEWGFDNEPDVLADWAAKQPGALPRDAYLPSARRFYGQ